MARPGCPNMPSSGTGPGNNTSRLGSPRMTTISNCTDPARHPAPPGAFRSPHSSSAEMTVYALRRDIHSARVQHCSVFNARPRCWRHALFYLYLSAVQSGSRAAHLKYPVFAFLVARALSLPSAFSPRLCVSTGLQC